MPRLSDQYLISGTFKEVLAKADAYAEQNGFEKWATRVVWIGLFYNVLAAKRYVQKLGGRTPLAQKSYQNLIKKGVFCESPEGIVWQEGVEPWHSDEVLWLNTVILIASGSRPPKGFPVLERNARS